MIDAAHLLNYIIRPVLKDLQLWSEDAERLVLGTACAESECGRWLRQLGNGPARGIYQSEAPAMIDNLEMIERKPAIKERLKKWISSPEPWEPEVIRAECVWNLATATAMCRIHYLRFPEPIPSTLPGQAVMWKARYNTESGRGTVAGYLSAWNRFVPTGVV